MITCCLLTSQAHELLKLNGKISGIIVDSLTNQPLEYATITLLSQHDHKLVNGSKTDEKGQFKIINIEEGAYLMEVNFIGYRQKEIQPVIIDKDHANVSLGNIKISAKQTGLKTVTVTAQKELIENKIDKMVYNADQDISSQGGVAADILKKVPQVSVDVNGNVELQGNANIRFLVNGKPSALFGSNITDVLQSIPASLIQRIEVITSPGAKYDAEGTGGIINIILKKTSAQGINGNISVSAGSRLENGSLNLNARKGRFSLNAYLSGNAQLSSSTKNSSERITYDSLNTSHLLQQGNSDIQRTGYQSGLGFDWELSHTNNLSGAVSYHFMGNDTKGSILRKSLLLDTNGNELSDVQDMMGSSSSLHTRSSDYNLSYKHTFKQEGRELELSANSSRSNTYEKYGQTQQSNLSSTILNGTKGNNPGNESETNINLNYTHPFTKNFQIETGAKAQFNMIKSNSAKYLLDTLSGDYVFSNSQSTAIDYNRQIYAGYLSTTFKALNWLDVKAGGRVESTQITADFSNSGKLTLAPYHTWVPSMVLAHTFKNRQTLKISYSHRIQRPDYRDLNPFINASDPKNISTGNSNLKPEIGDKIELSYNRNFKKGLSINTTLFYRGNTNDIQSYTRYYPTYKVGDSTYTNVSVNTTENIGRENNFGWSLFASLNLNDKITLRTNISAFERYIITGIGNASNIHGFNYRANLNATAELSKTLVMEAFGNFNSPRMNAQGTMPSFTTYNLAIRKQLFNKKGSLAMTTTNLFNRTVHQKTSLTGENFTYVNTRELPYRSFGINFTYKFGHLEFKKGREPEDANMTNPPGGER